MKTAGDVLSSLFDEKFVKKARGYSKLFDSWTDITAKNGIAAAADHSRIKDLDRGILLVEMDHPGWKQILQTKQSKLLNDFRIRFPELDISGISLMLCRPDQIQRGEPEQGEIQTEKQTEDVNEGKDEAVSTAGEQLKTEQINIAEKEKPVGIEAIKDEEFRESLLKLGKSIAAREKR